MKFRKLTAITAAVCAIFTSIAIPSSAQNSLPAFPGAEGGGMWATGARSNVSEVYHVTNLNDQGLGSLRDAVSESNRVIVFDVAGNIELVNALNITGDNLTILGQTAPGDGICIKNNTTMIYGDNVIIRYMRFRMGDALKVEDDTIGGRGLNNVILDHCSISWCVDECASFYENTNFTMQWCIISESLKESVHGKGNHGYGGIWGGQNASFHHNLIAGHDSRNPRIATAGIDAAYDDVTKQTDLTDLRNNVIYNWGGNSAYGGENGAPVNLVNCYYKAGPATTKKSRIFQISAKAEGDNTGTNSLNRPGWGTDLYVSGNYVEGYSDVTADNTKGVDTDSNSQKYSVWTSENITDAEKTVHNRYINDYPITTQTAQEAYNDVLAGAGASIVRDSIDTRLINEVKTDTAACGANGLINTPSEAGGYPELTGQKAKDSDNDGIPNEWEDKNGLNKLDKTDAVKLNADGYMYIEQYANALADKSYVRDVNYDPNVPDYDPNQDPNTTPAPTPAPAKELVSEWTATAGDETKAAGSYLMPGLKNVITLSRKMTNSITFPDGKVYSFAITHKDTSGGWDKANGVAKGCALEFSAPCDGVFTLYAYSVSGTKTFYVVPKGAASQTDNIYSEEITGSAVPIIVSIDMKQGETNYFYLAGSKARFCGAKYEKYAAAPATPAPTATPEPTATPAPEVYASDGVMIRAEFNADGTLKAIASMTEVKAGDAAIKADSDNEKIFVWKSLRTMMPVEIKK